jgi:hypothetical protein
MEIAAAFVAPAAARPSFWLLLRLLPLLQLWLM